MVKTKKGGSTKMTTLEQRAVGVYKWTSTEEARIERNLFAYKGDTWEGIRFCKNRKGRHLRVHLVVQEDEFVELFRDAVQKGVFTSGALKELAEVSRQGAIASGEDTNLDPILAAAGIGEDGTLTHNIDEALYGPSHETLR